MEKMLEILKKIKSVVMDSRKIEEGDLFLAINNGNNYIKDVLEKGAGYVIADNPGDFADNPRVIVVKDTVKAVQELAKEYVKHLKDNGLKVITITGSNGKTTTKDLIYSVLSQGLICKKTEGNYNNHIGVPYTLLNLKPTDEVAVIEMGMSGFGEIDLLSRIAQPDFGIITNIGDSHLEFLKTRENVFKAKTEMVPYVDPANMIVYGDDPFLSKLNAVKIRLEKFQDMEDGAEFRIFEENYKINLNGRHNALNAAMAVYLGKRFLLSQSEIQRGLLEAQITKMRFEKIEKENRQYINDAYNASPISMVFSLETFAEVYRGKNRIAVLGDMLELGEKEIDFHKEIIKKALELGIEKIYLYGPRMEKAMMEFKDTRLTHFADKEDLKKALLNEREGLTILLKGSRGMKLEEVIV